MVREVDLVCRCGGCGKVCKNKGGLALHLKRMHRVVEEKARI